MVGRVTLLPNRVPRLLNGLEVEVALADMAASIWLITVEAEALSTPFHLLGWCVTLEDVWLPRNSSDGWLDWGSCSRCWCYRARAMAASLLLLQLL